ncbi:Zinc finger, CCCH-type [Dillenia turbinata]|uniref:Zinc finger, CCCH-type n=1 Tax=Dillenia turbinata TaxID=194707 RepID=A0AAN8VML2_9MAGN
MERYGRSSATEELEPDPAAEWNSPATETGLEESMWRLGLGNAESYPERPDEADCMHYLRTGHCRFGARCRFNHPRDRSVAEAVRHDGGEYPERIGQPVCQYFMRTGTCKFGASCKYDHPRQGSGAVSPVSLNYHGFPLRPGEKECSYYVKTGHCKFGSTCKFHHPQPTAIDVPTPVLAPAPIAAAAAVPTPTYLSTVQSPLPSSQQYGIVTGNWQVPRPQVLPSPYVQGPYGPLLVPTGMVAIPGWTTYPTPVSPVASPGTQPTAATGPYYGMTQLSPSAPAYTGSYAPIPSSVGPSSSVQKENTFPERPGQPDCQYYMKTGDCKFGSSCRYHHPPVWIAPNTNCILGPMGLPLRPGAPPCTYYAQHGECKFGPTCKFDHPMGILSYSPSASSLADMPVAPYPIGSSLGILAPSSSSSDLRQELNSGSNKDSSTRMSSSMSTSTGSVSSIFSKAGVIPNSSVQGQGSGPPNGSSGSGHEGETHTSG